MNCREFVDFLMDYLEDALPAAQRTVFIAHLDGCPACITYLETYRETVRLGKQLCGDPEGPVPQEVPEDLVQAILAARSGAS
jgi:anti-sigma factor RsiW